MGTIRVFNESLSIVFAYSVTATKETFGEREVKHVEKRIIVSH